MSKILWKLLEISTCHAMFPLLVVVVYYSAHDGPLYDNVTGWYVAQ
jgi:hypothetical protein